MLGSGSADRNRRRKSSRDSRSNEQEIIRSVDNIPLSNISTIAHTAFMGVSSESRPKTGAHLAHCGVQLRHSATPSPTFVMRAAMSGIRFSIFYRMGALPQLGGCTGTAPKESTPKPETKAKQHGTRRGSLETNPESNPAWLSWVTLIPFTSFDVGGDGDEGRKPHTKLTTQLTNR